MSARDSRHITIEGSTITDISSFYAEINRVFMAGESWKLAPSLDALNDMLYGSYGAIEGGQPVVVLWQDMAASRAALGIDATRRFLLGRMKDRSQFNGSAITAQIEALNAGRGKTYFDIVLDVFAEHPNIELSAG